MDRFAADHQYKLISFLKTVMRADGSIGHHLQLEKRQFQGRLEDRPHIHWCWNQLVPPSPGVNGLNNTWEKYEIALLEPLETFEKSIDNKPFAVTPYDTLTIGQHRPSDRGTLLVPNSIVNEVRKFLVGFAGEVVSYDSQRKNLRQAIVETLSERYKDVWPVCDENGTSIGTKGEYQEYGFRNKTCLKKSNGEVLVLLYQEGNKKKDLRRSSAMQEWNKTRFIGLHLHSKTYLLEDRRNGYFRSLKGFTGKKETVKNNLLFAGYVKNLRFRDDLGVLQALEFYQNLISFEASTGAHNIADYVINEAIYADIVSLFFQANKDKEFNFSFEKVKIIIFSSQKHLLKLLNDIDSNLDADGAEDAWNSFETYKNFLNKAQVYLAKAEEKLASILSTTKENSDTSNLKKPSCLDAHLEDWNGIELPKKNIAFDFEKNLPLSDQLSTYIDKLKRMLSDDQKDLISLYFQVNNFVNFAEKRLDAEKKDNYRVNVVKAIIKNKLLELMEEEKLSSILDMAKENSNPSNSKRPSCLDVCQEEWNKIDPPKEDTAFDFEKNSPLTEQLSNYIDKLKSILSIDQEELISLCLQVNNFANFAEKRLDAEKKDTYRVNVVKTNIKNKLLKLIYIELMGIIDITVEKSSSTKTEGVPPQRLSTPPRPSSQANIKVYGRQRFRILPTTGDGFCAIHALLGEKDASGWLYWNGSRMDIMNKILEWRDQDPKHFQEHYRSFFSALILGDTREYDARLKARLKEPLAAVRSRLEELEESTKKERTAILAKRDAIIEQLVLGTIEIQPNLKAQFEQFYDDRGVRINLQRAIKTHFKGIYEWLEKYKDTNPEISRRCLELAALETQRIKLDKEESGIKDQFTERHFDSYLSVFLENSYYLTELELQVVALAMNKKVHIIKEENCNKQNVEPIPEDFIVIWHGFEHYERCEPVRVEPIDLNPPSTPEPKNTIPRTKNNYTSAKELPDLVIEKILAQIHNNKEGFNKISKVSKHWIPLWVNAHKLSLSNIGINSLEQTINFVTQHGKRLKYLKLGYEDLTDDQFEKIVKFCPNLTTLKLSSPRISNKGSECLKSLSKLNWLQIDSIEALNPLFLPASLKILRLWYCKMTDVDVKNLPSNLEQLYILGCHTLKALDTAHLPANLKILALTFWNPLLSIDVTNLPKTLESLTILVDWDRILPTIDITKLPNTLQKLSLYHFSNLTFEPAKLPSNLKILNLGNINNLNTLDTATLPHNLQKLNLTACSNLTAFDAMRLPANLRQLEIHYCPGVPAFDETLLPRKLKVDRL